MKLEGRSREHSAPILRHFGAQRGRNCPLPQRARRNARRPWRLKIRAFSSPHSHLARSTSFGVAGFTTPAAHHRPPPLLAQSGLRMCLLARDSCFSFCGFLVVEVVVVVVVQIPQQTREKLPIIMCYVCSENIECLI